MEYRKDHLSKVGHEGFEIIDACYGPNKHLPAPQNCKYVYPGPQTQTVLLEPVSNSSTYVYPVHHHVPAGKQACPAPVPASKEVAFSGSSRRHAYQVPQIAKPKEPVTWFICKVPQVFAGNEGIITSDQAAKNYGGLVSKEYYW